MGYSALTGNHQGGHNTVIGYESAKGVTDNAHSFNSAVGYRSLYAVTSGGSNTVMGYLAGSALTTGGNNTALGANALKTSIDVQYAVAIGESAMADGDVTAAADATVAIGYQALKALTSGGGNIAVGFEAGLVVTDNTDNVMIGHQAFNASDSGDSENVVIGSNAGGAINHGSSDGNVLIGLSAGLGGAGCTG